MVASYGLDADDWNALEREVVDLFTALLRVDTTNPPGNETACALVLKEYLAGNGIERELVGETPARQNLVARLDGARPGSTLTYMGHMDVVPADAGEWSVPPFGGVVKDGYVWGCGATDMKNQVAAEAVALARLKRSGADFAGTVKFAATVDEEDGDQCGVRWLCHNAPDALRCRLPRQRRHGRPVAASRRPESLSAGRRREGLRPVPHPHARPRRSRLGAGEGAQRGHRPGARRRRPRPLRPAGHRSRRSRRSSSMPSSPIADLRARLKDPADGARCRRRAAPARCGSRWAGRAAARCNVHAHHARRRQGRERDPHTRRGVHRLPHPARDERRRYPRSSWPPCSSRWASTGSSSGST